MTLSRRALFAAARAEPRPRAAGRTLIRGCEAVITMDPAVGDIEDGDVLIEAGRIAAFGKGLSADGAEVVDGAGAFLAPGLVDAYRQSWMALVVGAQSDFAPDRLAGRKAFMQRMQRSLSPQDLELAAYVGGLSAIDSGVTTVVDHPSAATSPAAVAAAGRGLARSGVGGVFCPPLASAAGAAPDGHLATGVWLGGADELSPEAAGIALREARALRPALILIDPVHVRGLAQAGLLGPDLHVVHGGLLDDEELALLAKAGASLAATPLPSYVEPGTAAHGRARKAGIATGVGLGSPVGYTADPFEHLRAVFFSLFRSKDGFDVAAPYKSPDTLAFATSEGARAVRLGERTGTIAVGKSADLMLVSTRRFGVGLLGTPADRLINFTAQDDIDSVWVAGVARKRRGVMLGVDWRALKAQVAAAQTRLFEAA